MSMQEYDDFFKEHQVRLKLGRKRILTPTVKFAHDTFLEYIKNNDMTSITGELVVGNEVIAIFSEDGRLWSSDEEEIVLDFLRYLYGYCNYYDWCCS